MQVSEDRRLRGLPKSNSASAYEFAPSWLGSRLGYKEQWGKEGRNDLDVIKKLGAVLRDSHLPAQFDESVQQTQEAMLSVFTIPSGMGHELTTATCPQKGTDRHVTFVKGPLHDPSRL